MSQAKSKNAKAEEELVSFQEVEESDDTKNKTEGKDLKKGHVAVHSSGFRDFLLKPELLRAVVDCGFEHPSEVQHQCIPQAILGMDVICQAKSGMGKTAVFVLAVLQQLEVRPGTISCLVLCHTRELAFQICNEFNRFSKYLAEVKTAVFYGGIKIELNREALKNEVPNIVVGTPGRVLQLAKEGHMDLSKVKHFVLDECDKMLQSLEMRKDVQDIFKLTPREKQVMMYSATLSKELRAVALKFMHNPMEIYVDDESKLTLHGLQQYYVKLTEKEKNGKLSQLLESLEFNQCVIFVRTVSRAIELHKLLVNAKYPATCIHSDMSQEERIKRYQGFKNFQQRILVSTDVFGRGIDIQKVNVVINYDMADSADDYLHRVGRAGRFGTKGLGISFISSDAPMASKNYERKVNDDEVLKQIQERFVVKIQPLPDTIDKATYMTA